MKRNEIENQEADKKPPAVVLDIQTIVQQLGINLANWPHDLPQLNEAEKEQT
ncbi:hypothetical protein [Paenibacillus glycinis]|uniref:Uncharacterized protein n=1 Tax=Paenibacillus glycinis TaxID=2697035 RepID=A0ABW9XLW9_9BACL|nr:hypothetical protein [Paenibacillus glycinis]NBD23620.1 hypothetical protein [Paenibacillus glycinis]